MRRWALLIYFWYSVNKENIKLFLKPSMLISFGIAWIITNGWSYMMFGAGVWLDIAWMKTVGLFYITLLYLPFTIEKPLTVAIAIFIQRKLFGIKLPDNWTYKGYQKANKLLEQFYQGKIKIRALVSY